VVARHLVELAALFVEPHPETPLLVEDVSDVQAAGRGDAGEREHHDPDQGTVPQPYHAVRRNRAQQLAGLLSRQHWGFALAELLARGLHGEGGVVLEHAAGDQVVEQHAHGGHVLLQCRRRQSISLGGLQIVAHVEGADVLYSLSAAVLKEGEERAQRAAVGPAGVVVVDGGAQEVLDAVASLATGAIDQGRWPTLSWCDNEILGEHRFALSPEGVRRST
jgi:hypothetical protein